MSCRFYLILNLALGGTLGGKIKMSDLPGELIVDYVRVYPGLRLTQNVNKWLLPYTATPNVTYLEVNI